MGRLQDGRVRANGDAELRTRKDQDYTERFAPVAGPLPRALRTSNCVLDGEVCAIDEQGRASFSAMQQGGRPLVYYVFDLLELEGEPLVQLPFTERRERLEEILDRAQPDGAALRGLRRRRPRSSRPPSSRVSKASWPSGPTRATSPASGAATG